MRRVAHAMVGLSAITGIAVAEESKDLSDPTYVGALPKLHCSAKLVALCDEDRCSPLKIFDASNFVIDLRSRVACMANPRIKPFPVHFSRIALSDKGRGFLALEFGAVDNEKPIAVNITVQRFGPDPMIDYALRLTMSTRSHALQEFGSCSPVSKEHAQRAPMGGM